METSIAQYHEKPYIPYIQNLALRTPKYVLKTSYIKIPTKYPHKSTMCKAIDHGFKKYKKIYK